MSVDKKAIHDICAKAAVAQKYRIIHECHLAELFHHFFNINKCFVLYQNFLLLLLAVSKSVLCAFPCLIRKQVRAIRHDERHVKPPRQKGTRPFQEQTQMDGLNDINIALFLFYTQNVNNLVQVCFRVVS